MYEPQKVKGEKLLKQKNFDTKAVIYKQNTSSVEDGSPLKLINMLRLTFIVEMSDAQFLIFAPKQCSLYRLRDKTNYLWRKEVGNWPIL